MEVHKVMVLWLFIVSFRSELDLRLGKVYIFTQMFHLHKSVTFTNFKENSNF